MYYINKLNLFFLAVLSFFGAEAKTSSMDGFESFVEQNLQEFVVPGISIGVIVDGEIVISRGYGVRDHKGSLPVTNKTLFAIGSCSKAITAFLAGLLVDEGKLEWDQPIISYLPSFKVKDPEINKQMTMVDLLSHRTGMPGHDEVWYGKPELSRKEIVEGIETLEFTEGFREKFQYNNLMYAAAGIVTEKITGNTWEEDVKEKILTPLNMKNTNFSVEVSKGQNDFALPHGVIEGTLQEIPFRNISNIGPAGSINSNIDEMLHWIEMLVNNGNYRGQQLIQSDTLNDLFTPRIAVPEMFPEEDRQLLGYALGWGISLYREHRIVSHDGGIDGFRSKVILLPEDKIGIVILSNGENGAYATNALGRDLVDRLLGIKGKDWLAEFKALQQQMKTLEDQRKMQQRG